MDQLTPIQKIFSALGYLSQISIGQPLPDNNQSLQLQQIHHIIDWTRRIKQDLQAEHNLRLSLEEQLNRQRLLPIRQELLRNIDIDIQNHFKQLNVQIGLGSELLIRIINVVDHHTLQILQQFDALKAHIDNIQFQLNQTNIQLQSLQNIRQEQPQIIVGLQVPELQNQINLSHIQIRQLQTKITGLEQSNKKLNEQLSLSIFKNQKLVQQTSKNVTVSPTITKVQNSTNDANIRIINELKGQKQVLNKKINQLVEQVIDANTRIEEVQKRAKKSNNVSPVRQTDIKSSSNNPKIKSLQLELISKQEQIQNLNSEVRNADAKIKQLIDELMNANGELLTYKSHKNEQQILSQQHPNTNKITELQTKLSTAYSQLSQLTTKHQSTKQQLGLKLLESQNKINDLVNQLNLSKNKIIDLQLDIEGNNLSSLAQNNIKANDKKVQVISHELLVANKKIEQMMTTVANYQNNVIDLELDKQALVFQLNDLKDSEENLEQQLKVQKYLVINLKEQIKKSKEDNNNHIPSNSRIEGSQRSYRQHRKIFDGLRQSAASKKYK